MFPSTISLHDIEIQDGCCFYDLPGGGKFAFDGNVGPINQANAALTPLEASVGIENPELTLFQTPDHSWTYSFGGLTAPSAPAGNRTPAPTPAPGSAATAPKQPDTPANTVAPPATSDALLIRKFDLKNGRVIVGGTGSQKRSTYEHVNVTATGVSTAAKFPVNITADSPGGGKFKLDGNVGPLDRVNMALSPLDAKIEVSSLNLASTGFLDPSLGLGGIADLNATATSQNGQMSTRGNLKLSKALLVAGGSPASVPATVDFNTAYDLRKSSGVLNTSTVKIGAAAARVGGTYRMADDATVVDVKLDGDNMPANDLQAFLPALGVNIPKGASLNAGELSAHLQMQGPTNKLVTVGNVGLTNGKLAGFDLGSKMSAVSALAGIKTGSDLVIQKLTSNLRMSPTGLQADQFTAVIPSLGTLAGSGTVDAKNNLDFKMAASVAASNAGAIGLVNSAVGRYSGVGKIASRA